VSDSTFQEVLKDIEKNIEINPEDTVLDLCCGNGLITTYLAPRCAKIVGVDVSPELIAQIDLEKYSNVSVLVDNIKKVDFEEDTFNKIIIYSGLQYLTPKESIELFESVMKWLKKDGIFLVGDVPDSHHLWDFADNEERQAAYFDALKNDRPFIGTWFEPQWLRNLGGYAGFTTVDIRSQPSELPFSHYRFDAILRK